MQSILITGGAGYVGSGLLRVLLNKGATVTCVDKLDFGGESILDIYLHPNFIFEKCDITDYAAFDAILAARPYDAVIHLAAIVGDPACKREPELARKVNGEASKRLLDRCIERGIPRFIFASTCSNYGKMTDPNVLVREDSPLAPVSLYAELKVAFEKYMLEEIPRSLGFGPTSLRFATVYGLSPRMRFDLTVNEFTKDLALGRELVVFGEQFWRPYCHVADFSRAITAVLDAPAETVAYEVFNVGDTTENYTKQMLVTEISRQIPGSRIKYVTKQEDPRDYRVDFTKIKERLGFAISRTVPEGIAEVRDVVRLGVISSPDDQRYYNIPHQQPAS